jgi:membrane protein YdbS with pleckstrin-like domain
MAVPFSNEPISTDRLPTLAADAFVSVDPRYVRASLVGYLLAAMVIVVGAFVATSQAERPIIPLAIGGALLVAVVLGAVLRVLEGRRLGYQLREHDLSLRSGAINHHVESLPFSRVQHVNVNRGPVERALGLATLQVSSAGPNITIPGLTNADAARIKALVTERTGDVDDTDTNTNTNDSPAPPQ